MSGIEIAGLVLGALPLMISAMEHYEETRKVTAVWWKIRRAHRKDLGRLRDCELKFKLNMRELLQPLSVDGTISQKDYAEFLGSTTDSRWSQPDIQEALAERLFECRDRYLEKLSEMRELLVKLAKATMVDDEKFQGGIAQQKQNINQPGIERFVVMANRQLGFELKRLNYSFSGQKREDLIEELERCNETLSQFLQANDRIAERSGTTGLSSTRRIKRKFRILIGFWDHAECLFGLIRNSWKCKCAALHCAQLWLSNCSALTRWELEFALRFSGDEKGKAGAGWTDQNLRVRLREMEDVDSQTSVKIRGNSNHLVQAQNAGSSKKGVRFGSSQMGTMTITAGPPALAYGPSTTLADLGAIGLCSIAQQKSAESGEALGFLSGSDPKRDYELNRSVDTAITGKSATLAELLSREHSRGLRRTDRLALALALASSYLKYFSTSWLPGGTTAAEVRVPVDPASGQANCRLPFMVASFETASSCKQADIAFQELAIVLLELCFGHALVEHAMWKKDLQMSTSYPVIMRKAVATEWCRDVKYEAGMDYAAAVEWSLLKASLKDPEWRVEFAQNVVQPLQTCYEAAVTGFASRGS